MELLLLGEVRRLLGLPRRYEAPWISEGRGCGMVVGELLLNPLLELNGEPRLGDSCLSAPGGGTIIGAI